MADIKKTIETLEQRLKQARAKAKKQEAQKRTAEAKARRAADTRRKILIGAVILAKVDKGEWPKEKLMMMLDKELKRTDERALFDLPKT
ncbi:MAG: hypothetical protein ACRC9N_00385 [Aeromonas sp.]